MPRDEPVSSPSSEPRSTAQGEADAAPEESSEEKKRQALTELENLLHMELVCSDGEWFPAWGRADVAAATLKCVDAGISPDEVYRAIWNFDADFLEEMADAAVPVLAQRGLSLSLSLLPCLQCEVPTIENVRSVLKDVRTTDANTAALTSGIDRVVKCLIQGPVSEMRGGIFPPFHPHPFHGDIRNDGTQNQRRADFCLEAFVALFDAGARPSDSTKDAIPKGILQWQAFHHSPPATNCYETPWDRKAINSTIQALWKMQHYPEAPPTPNPPALERKCVECKGLLPATVPYWKIRCLNCWKLLKKREAESALPKQAKSCSQKQAEQPSSKETTHGQGSAATVAKGAERKCLDCAAGISPSSPRWKVRCVNCWRKWKSRA